MNSLSIALLTLACVFGGALLGMLLRNVLPNHHLSRGSRDTVGLMTGLTATLSALVLGLLIASAKDSYDNTDREFRQVAARMIVLDQALVAYGSETREIRSFLRDSFSARVDQLFPKQKVRPEPSAAGAQQLPLEQAERRLREFTPPEEAKKAHLTRALKLLDDMNESAWLLTVEEADNALPAPMLAVLVSWLTAMFLGFGLFAPRNATAVIALLVGSLAVSTSIFLIEEMSHPLAGIISISEGPLRSAVEYLGR